MRIDSQKHKPQKHRKSGLNKQNRAKKLPKYLAVSKKRRTFAVQIRNDKHNN